MLCELTMIGQNLTAAEGPVLERLGSGRDHGVVDRGGQREERARKLLLRLCAAPFGAPEVVSASSAECCDTWQQGAKLGPERDAPQPGMSRAAAWIRASAISCAPST